ncbi:MAG: S8 family peptidase [Bacteroidetes bacterium]|nr:S8 family peptidase [Bacteroidota bacterium]
MKKFMLLSIVSFFLCGFSTSWSLSQNPEINSFKQTNLPYAFEERWIEVMFSTESKVRMRNGNIMDLATQALQGTGEILKELKWYRWHRLTDVPESTVDRWEVNGELNTGQDLYNLNNIYRLEIADGNDTWKIAERLQALPGIYLARPVPKPVELPIPTNFQSQQGYLNPATNNPSGIDAIYSWTQTGGTGAGVTICDLEYSWNYNHADITKALGSQINTNVVNPFSDNHHGTAVIGELVANSNGWGTTGICYGANLKTCGTYYGSPSPTWNVAGAMAVAIAALSAGDIILLEQQWWYNGSTAYVPIEWYSDVSPNPQTNNPVYAAIVTAIANGIHVVEAGGNGNVNTGSMIWYGNSGAIIVGAGGALTTNDRTRLSFSSYGPRFDLQGWGETVFTTGYGDYYSSEGANYYYTSTFNGTSSASPVVAGALACIEGYYLANVSSVPPTPSYMRNLMVSNGTVQIFPPTGVIGPRPNIKNTILNIPVATSDFGDAPDGPYPTKLSSNGARHINTGLRLGMLIDSELDGQPNATATGDDINPLGADDEDGVTFTSSLTAGQLASVQVIASAPGLLNAWIDFNKINAWADPGEQIFTNVVLTPGLNLLSFLVPSTAAPGVTYARFRFNLQGGLSFFGPATDGEAEDYQVFIEEQINLYDWGDAPDGPYPTYGSNNGAYHKIDQTTFLGPTIDAESDGQPTPLADGDDLANIDDEDGVVFMWPLAKGNPCKLKVNASVGNALFNCWIDFNGNGSWADPNEQVFMDLNLLAGDNYLTFITPQTAKPGPTFARFRFSHQPGLSYTGYAFDGEVEDYAIDLIEYGDMKWQQLPDTLLPGMHATDASLLADDWICNGEVITDLHWWGNYETDAGGVEKRGSGIHHFLLHIYSDISCLPNTILKTYIVPYVPGLEINTGMINHERSIIYRYDFPLPEPFIQTKDSTYWFSVQAISKIVQSPPSWRWQEANRWMIPIHCKAAENLGSVWQPITWPFPPLIKYDDFAFQVTSWVVDTLYLQNINVTSGQVLCYNANNVIVVAGSGTTFTVQPGASATMIAGTKILYLPGTSALTGCYMHGLITTSGVFCPRAPAMTGTVEEPSVEAIAQLISSGTACKVYPNPTYGMVFLEPSDQPDGSAATIELYGMMGEKILSKQLPPQNRYELSLALQPPGVYILRYITGKETGTVKIIKQ